MIVQNATMESLIPADGLVYLGALFLVVLGGLYLQLLRSIVKHDRHFVGLDLRHPGWLLFITYFVGLYSLCFYRFPELIEPGLGWSDLKAATSDTLPIAAWLWYANGLLLIGYFSLSLSFHNRHHYSLVTITSLSIISGLAGSTIIMVIHQATMDLDKLSNWIPYFIGAVSLATGGVKVVQSRLVGITNQIVYQKRVEFIDKVLSSDYHRIENMEKGNIEACLNNDTETISDFATSFVSILTSAMTTIGCFLYLAVLNFTALAAILGVIFIATIPTVLIFLRVTLYWEQNRTMQGRFFKYIADLISGLKELKLKQSRRNHFQQDMVSVTQQYVDTQIKGNLAIVNVRILVEVMFYTTIGIVLFAFPVVFNSISLTDISAYLLIFIFMMAQITILATGIPEVLKIKVSWDRINQSIKDIDNLEQTDFEPSEVTPGDKSVYLELKDIVYHYRQPGNTFQLGPISCTFRSGEITFVTGGNGSGKSTLAKLITGLYVPDSGTLMLNGTTMSRASLGEHFSTVFSDFHLFDTLYGLTSDHIAPLEQHYLEKLKLTGKVNVQEGAFNTTQLSTGQRKRLALFITYLEDSPILLFDEWAADQDPQFRRFFYTKLLPDLRAQGKCVIAITHDDQYFNTADVVISLESGSVKKITANENKDIRSEEEGTCVK